MILQERRAGCTQPHYQQKRRRIAFLHVGFSMLTYAPQKSQPFIENQKFSGKDLKMATYEAYVTRVIDGDTFEIRTQTGLKPIRLDNINTPEEGRIGALAATNYLKTLIEGQNVIIEERGTGTWGRTLAHVWRKSDNLPVNNSIVQQGHSEWIQ